MKTSNGLIDDAQKTLYGVNLLLGDLNRKIGVEADRDIAMSVLEILHDVKDNIFKIEETLFSNIKKTSWQDIWGQPHSRSWRREEPRTPKNTEEKEEENEND